MVVTKRITKTHQHLLCLPHTLQACGGLSTDSFKELKTNVLV